MIRKKSLKQNKTKQKKQVVEWLRLVRWKLLLNHSSDLQCTAYHALLMKNPLNTVNQIGFFAKNFCPEKIEEIKIQPKLTSRLSIYEA